MYDGTVGQSQGDAQVRRNKRRCSKRSHDLYEQRSLADCRYFDEAGNLCLIDTPTDHAEYQKYRTAAYELIEHEYIRPSMDPQDAKAYRLTEEGYLVAEYLPDPEADA